MHDRLAARGGGGSQHHGGAAFVGVVDILDVAPTTQPQGVHARNVEARVGADQSFGEGRGIQQVALDDLNVEPLDGAAVAAAAHQHSHRNTVTQQLAHDRAADESAGPCDEGCLHGRQDTRDAHNRQDERTLQISLGVA